MGTIQMYIDNLFQNLPKTQEVLKAREELLSMMEDKYNELKAEGKSENEAIGIVISEFGNIDELKEGLGIKSVSDNSENNGSSVNLNKQEVTARKVTMDEAVAFIKDSYTFSIKIALGVVLCIISVVPLIVLNGFLKENTAGAIGFTFMFIVIAIAVALFITSGLKQEKYNYLKKEKLELDYSTAKYVKDLKENYKNTFAVRITLGVILCIISAVPVILVGILFDKSDFYSALSVGGLLIIVATAVVLFITAGIKMDSYKQLLQEEDYTPQKKVENELVGKIAAIYWPLMVVIYLSWSFISMAWEKTWIIWPVAGVMFAVIAGICNAIAPNKKDN